MKYLYQDSELYNIKFMKNSLMGYFCMANWKDPKENNKEKLGKFYLKELTSIKEDKELKEEFKKEVLKWLAENNLFPKKVRVYKTCQYGLDVRVYTSIVETTNSRKSFRERKEERDNQRHGSYGIHTRNISLYIAISERDWKNKEEKEFILEVLKNELK